MTSGTIAITQWYDQPLSLDQLEGDYLLLLEDGRSLVVTFTRHVVTENGTGPEVLRFTGRAFLAQSAGAERSGQG